MSFPVNTCKSNIYLDLSKSPANQNTSTNYLPTIGFTQLAEISKKVHTFKYFLNRNSEHKEIDEKNGTFINKELYKTIQLITLEEFEATLDHYSEIMNSSQKNPELWVAKDVPTLFHVSKKEPGSTFDGYTTRILSPIGTDYILVPDLHGDVHSLVAFIENLHKTGFTLDDPLKLAMGCNLVFMGDFTDRGLFGVEVIYLLMRLKINNPDQVVLLRGNHEDSEMTSTLGFDYECESKFGVDGFKRCQKKIEDFNNSLPLALYYGSTGTDGINYQRLACHANAEIGYKPEKLLKMSLPLSFERIKSFNRLSEAKMLPDFQIKYGEKQVSLVDVCEDFVALTPQKPHRIGFQWFNLKIQEGEVSTYNQTTGFETNKELTLALLDHCNDDNNVLMGMDRGHQHNPNFVANPLMELILKCNGCATVFNERVATLNVAPDSFHGLKNESFEKHLNFTYCIRTTGSNAVNWKEKVINVPVRTGI